MNKKSTLGMVLTSWLFFLTGLYAYLSKQYVFAIVNLLVWFLSVWNWSCMFQCSRWKLLAGIDRMVAHAVFVFYVYKGTQVMNPFHVFVMVNAVVLAYLLSCANFKLDQRTNKWKYNHMYFHLLGNICILYIIHQFAIKTEKPEGEVGVV